MELSPSCEGISCSAIKEFPNILWNQKLYYHVQKILPLVSIAIQLNPNHTITYFAKINFNIILPFTFRPS
jgi:hypothetical protein